MMVTLRRRAMDTTGKSLVEHWDWAAQKGLMNSSTARVLQNACLQILKSVYADEWESKDVATINRDEVFVRFQNLRSKNLTPRSLQDYKRRFQQALESFESYVRDPASWKGPGQDRPSRNEGGSSSERVRVRQRTSKATPTEATGSDLIDYPFPLGELTAHLILPRNLRMMDARRLSSFIASLASDWEGPNGRPLLARPVGDN
jgi:hypothetical protein